MRKPELPGATQMLLATTAVTAGIALFLSGALVIAVRFFIDGAGSAPPLALAGLITGAVIMPFGQWCAAMASELAIDEYERRRGWRK